LRKLEEPVLPFSKIEYSVTIRANKESRRARKDCAKMQGIDEAWVPAEDPQAEFSFVFTAEARRAYGG
jgi:hypothetical protein